MPITVIKDTHAGYRRPWLVHGLPGLPASKVVAFQTQRSARKLASEMRTIKFADDAIVEYLGHVISVPAHLREALS